MLVAFGLICIVANLVGIFATICLRDFPAPGGKFANIAIHTVGAWCGWVLIH